MKSNNLRTEQRAKATTINTATTATTTKIVELNIRVHLCTEDKNTKKKIIVNRTSKKNNAHKHMYLKASIVIRNYTQQRSVKREKSKRSIVKTTIHCRMQRDYACAGLCLTAVHIHKNVYVNCEYSNLIYWRTRKAKMEQKHIKNRERQRQQQAIKFSMSF